MTPLTPPQSQASPIHLDTLDGIKIVGCLLIVCYHFFPYIGGTSGQYFFWPLRNARVMVDVFFIISGIVIAHNYGGKIKSGSSYADFMKRRIARLYPLHLATLLFYSIIGLAIAVGYLHVAIERKYDFNEWLPNFFMIQAWGFSQKTAFNFPSWSVSAEFFAYLSFPLVYGLVARSSTIAIITIIILFAAGIAFSELQVGRNLSDLTVPWSIFRSLPSFCVGVALFRYHNQLPHLQIKVLRMAFLGSAALFVLAMLFIENSYVLLATATLFVATAFLVDRDGIHSVLSTKTLVRSAYLTYPIYMLHAPIATIFIAFIFPRTLGTLFSIEWVRIICILSSIVITIIVSWISYRYFEKPMRNTINLIQIKKKLNVNAKTKIVY